MLRFVSRFSFTADSHVEIHSNVRLQGKACTTAAWATATALRVTSMRTAPEAGTITTLMAFTKVCDLSFAVCVALCT